MILRNITYVKYMSRKEAAKNKQLLFFLSHYRFSNFFSANTSEVSCNVNSF